MNALRSDRAAAALLLLAAVIGLLLGNSPVAPQAFEIRDLTVGPTVLHLDLSLGHWVSDGFLAVFFFLAAIELRHEFQHGELDSARRAIVPAVAAVAGVVVPAVTFVLVVSDAELRRGWPIPTATDIAFALGILAIVGRSLPSRVRATLLALAVIDDLIAIILIAVLFTERFEPLPLLGAVLVVALFGVLSTLLRRRRRAVLVVALVALGVVAWALVHASGVHATVAGVALGLAMAPGPASTAAEAITPWSNVVILPLFAFTASLVTVPAVGFSGLSPVFWGIVVALPLGKLIGIGLGAVVASRIAHPRGGTDRLPTGDVAVIATLGGVGFTVSLLMNELAFARDPDIEAEGTLAVLVGSVIAMLAGLAVTAARARRYR